VEWQDVVALLTLVGLELVLGVDNVVVLEALVAKLDPADQRRTWQWGLSVAIGIRVALLWLVSALVLLRTPWFTVGAVTFSPHALLLGAGGGLLVFKGLRELARTPQAPSASRFASPRWVFVQILLMDVVLSIDSVYTAVGLSQTWWVMAASIVIAGVIVLRLRSRVHAWIQRSSSLQRLVWALLLVIGASLLADAVDAAMPKWILYALVGCALVFDRWLGRPRSMNA